MNNNDANKTMQLIGKQYICRYIEAGAPAAADFKAVLEANRLNPSLFDIGVDFFTLGIMYGKKAERAARNNKELQPLTGGNHNDKTQKRF